MRDFRLLWFIFMLLTLNLLIGTTEGDDPSSARGGLLACRKGVSLVTYRPIIFSMIWSMTLSKYTFFTKVLFRRITSSTLKTFTRWVMK